MIYTTYFAKLKSLPKDIIPISICGKAPAGYKGLEYKKLAPKYDFFKKWKKYSYDENGNLLYWEDSDGKSEKYVVVEK